MLVLQKYFEGDNKYKWDKPDYYGERIHWAKDSMHSPLIMSCTKSFTSACIGIAIDKGFIKSVNESIFNYLSDYQSYNTDGKENISIEHLFNNNFRFEME